MRVNYDLRDSIKNDSQHMLNDIEPGTVIPIRKHVATSKNVIALRGIAEEVFFDDNGNEIGRSQLIPGSDTHAIHIPKGAISSIGKFANVHDNL